VFHFHAVTDFLHFRHSFSYFYIFSCLYNFKYLYNLWCRAELCPPGQAALWGKESPDEVHGSRSHWHPFCSHCSQRFTQPYCIVLYV